MSHKPTVVLSLAAAIASLMGASTATNAKATSPANEPNGGASAPDSPSPVSLKANAVFAAGDEMMSFVMSERADGAVVAQHVSHASHASHASHHSHYSSSF